MVVAITYLLLCQNKVVFVNFLEINVLLSVSMCLPSLKIRPSMPYTATLYFDTEKTSGDR